MKMIVSYDPEIDVLYLHFKDGATKEVIEAGEDVIIELDENGEIMGIEIWRASERGLLRQLESVLMLAKSRDISATATQ